MEDSASGFHSTDVEYSSSCSTTAMGRASCAAVPELMMANILIVDDEKAIRELIGYICEIDGYKVFKADSVEEARTIIGKERLDLIVLDWMLPGESGISWLRELKTSKHSGVPVLMLSAKGEEIDRVDGLDAGADDYIVKPFLPKELSARMRAAMRRSKTLSESGKSEREDAICSAGVSLDAERFEVLVHGRPAKLSVKEFKLLQLLMKNKGRVYSRDEILRRVWDNEYIDARVVDVHVLKIRRALQSAAGVLETVRGVGYRFKE